MLADRYGSFAAVVAGVVIATGGPAGIDALAALTVAALMLRSGFVAVAVAAHVVVAPDDDCHLRRRELQALLHERFGIDHTTLQVDHESWHPLVQIEGSEPG